MTSGSDNLVLTDSFQTLIILRSGKVQALLDTIFNLSICSHRFAAVASSMVENHSLPYGRQGSDQIYKYK